MTNETGSSTFGYTVSYPKCGMAGRLSDSDTIKLQNLPATGSS